MDVYCENMKKVAGMVLGKIKEWFSIDYRSLAIMRVGVGLTILLDLAQRAEDLRTFYSDQGILPRGQFLEIWNSPWWVSIHMASGMWEFQALLFIIAGIFAVMLIVGYRTQLAIVISWFLLISLHSRNPIVLQGGDVLFRVIIFWMMFLPLGRVWSVDRLFNKIPQPKSETVFSVATIGYIVQICLLYLFTGLLKTGVAWHADGTAVYYALNIDQLVTPIGMLLREFPVLMKILTHVTWYVETYGIVLFFSVLGTGLYRSLGVLMFALLQLGFNVSMRLGLFGLIAVVSTLGLLPSSFWNNFMSSIYSWIANRGKAGLKIYYDFDCTFCYKATSMIKRFLFLNPQTVTLPGNTDTSVQKIMDTENSWVVIDESGMTYIGFTGAIIIFKHSPILFWITPILRLDFISNLGEKIYRYVANHRLSVCVSEPIEKPKNKKQKYIFIAREITLGILVIYVIFWNINTFPGKKIMPPSLEWIGSLTRLDQQFNMFAPTPLLEDGWYVFPGVLRDNTEIDVFSGTSLVSYEKPKLVAYTYKNQRWQKYMMNLWNKDFDKYRLLYGQYLCREWNDHHKEEKQLMKFDMVFMVEKTPPPGKEFEPLEKEVLWKHSCY